MRLTAAGRRRSGEHGSTIGCDEGAPCGHVLAARPATDLATCDPGDLVAIEVFACPGSDTASTAPEPCVSVTISRRSHPELHALVGDAGAELLDARGQLLADFLGVLADRLPGRTDLERAALEPMIAAVLAAFLRPAKGAPQEGIRPVRRAWVEAVIQRNVGSARFNVAWLCQATNLSRSSLHRMFEAEGGAASHIRHLRLRMAHEILSDPATSGTRISEVAEACGFHNAASFNRAFRASFGCTPGEVRARSCHLRRAPVCAVADPIDGGVALAPGSFPRPEGADMHFARRG